MWLYNNAIPTKGIDMCRNFALLMVACFLFSSLLPLPAISQNFVNHVSTGQEVPFFSITTIDGKSFDTNALKGKIVLVNFWATWCAPCRVEMPLLEKEVWGKCKGPDFDMIAIARKETNQEIAAFKKTSLYSFPMAADPEGKIYYKFADAGIPRNYLIGPDGKVIYQSIGYSPDDFKKMAKLIEKELNKLRNRAEHYFEGQVDSLIRRPVFEIYPVLGPYADKSMLDKRDAIKKRFPNSE
jgi:thiol-disulfide isomerase/thioredoxin